MEQIVNQLPFHRRRRIKRTSYNIITVCVRDTTRGDRDKYKGENYL